MLCRRTFSSPGAAATAVGDHFGNAAARAGAFAATGIRPCGSHDPRALPNAILLNGYATHDGARNAVAEKALHQVFGSSVAADQKFEVSVNASSTVRL